MTEESVTEPEPLDEVGARIDVVRLSTLEGERHLREGLLEEAATLFRAALEGLGALMRLPARCWRRPACAAVSPRNGPQLRLILLSGFVI